jgi:toxin YoeB
MRIVFSERAWEDYLYWQATDRRELKRIHQLLRDLSRPSYDGIGKPELLKHALAGLLMGIGWFTM